MIKLLLLILLGLLLMAFGYKTLLSDESTIKVPGSQNTQYFGPADAIEGAKGAVDQSQNVQDKLNQQAQDQLNQ